MTTILDRITRERAVIFGVALAILEALANNEITPQTAVPIIAGIILRFLVTPYPPKD